MDPQTTVTDRTRRPLGRYLSIISALLVALIGLDRSGMSPSLRTITSVLYEWMILLGAFALLLGVLNVITVHLRRIQTGQQEWQFSVALLAGLTAVLVVGLVMPRGVRSEPLEWVYDHLLLPGYSTLFALMAFFLAAAAYRYLRIGRTGGAWMLAGVLLMLAAQAPIYLPWLRMPLTSAMSWFIDYPLMGAMRGVLLGSGIALLVTAAYLLTTHSE